MNLTTEMLAALRAAGATVSVRGREFVALDALETLPAVRADQATLETHEVRPDRLGRKAPATPTEAPTAE